MTLYPMEVNPQRLPLRLAGAHDALILKAEPPGSVKTQGPEEVQKEGAPALLVADVL